MRRLSILFLALTACTSGRAPSPPPAGNPPVVSKPAEISATTGPAEFLDSEKGGCFGENCRLVFDGRSFEIRYDPAKGTHRLVSEGKSRGEVRLSDDELPTVEKIYLNAGGANLIISAQLSDGESGASKVLAIDRESARRVWTLDLPGFNLGAPVQVGSDLYVSVIGFVGKIDLTTGRFRWKHENLYDKTGFNGVALVRFKQDVVEFDSDGVIIRVHDRSGKLVEPAAKRGK